MHQERGDPAPAPPPRSHTAAVVTTTLVLTVWAVLTFGASVLAPSFAAAGEWIEVSLGLDKSLGKREPNEVP